MWKYKSIIYLILVIATSSSCEDNVKQSEEKTSTETKQQENINNRRSFSNTKTSRDGSSFASKLGIWQFAVGSSVEHENDQTSSATSYSGSHYLPSRHDDTTGIDCDSCNEVPWVPVIGKQTLDYAPSYEYSSHSNVHYKDRFSIPGHHFTSPGSSYSLPTSQFKQPHTHQLPSPHREVSFRETINIPVDGDLFITDYMVPPPINFKIPSPAYGILKPNRGLPNAIYGVPQYPPPSGPTPTPLTPLYGPPIPQNIPPTPYPSASPWPSTRPPIPQGPPRPQYGPPPADGVLPPPRPSNGSFPNFPPRPFPQYGPPPAGGIIPPQRPNSGSTPQPQYGPPRPIPQYGLPSVGNSRPPNGFLLPNQFRPPSSPSFQVISRPEYDSSPYNNRPPGSRPQYNAPLPNYGPPPAFNYGVPPPSSYIPSPAPSYGPPSVTPIPILLPPPISDNPQEGSFIELSENVDSGQNQYQESSSFESHSDVQLAPDVETADQNSNLIPPAVPSDSYGNAVTGDSLHYVVPTDTVYSSSSERDVIRNPPNFSNLNQLRYEFRNIDKNSRLNDLGYKSQTQQINTVEIQPSVQVADYLASVEHPVTVVQSPLHEVAVKEEQVSQNTEPEPTSINNLDSVYRQGGYEQNSNSHGTFKLSDNPIVVDDTFTASSNINSSYTSSNQTNESKNRNHIMSSFDQLNDIEATGSAKDEDDLIKKLLLQQGILGNPDTSTVKVQKIHSTTSSTNNFINPTVDYSNWIPTKNENTDSLSTSMVPPAANTQSMWVQNNFVTPTGQPLQIIVPYIKNKNDNGIRQQSTSDNDFNVNNEGYTTLISTYMPPMSKDESNWSKFLDDYKLLQSNGVTARPFTKQTTAVYNIKDLLKASYDPKSNNLINLPYDVISLQKNIDEWTHQSFSRTNQDETENASPTKNIPPDFFTVQSQTFFDNSTTRNDDFDHDSASSNKRESFVSNKEIETNMVADGDSSTVRSTSTSSTTELSTSTSASSPATARKFQRNLWDDTQVTESPYTREKVYVVTPQSYNFYTTPATAWSMAPKIENGRANNVISNSQKFSVRVEQQEKEPKKTKQKDFFGKTLLKVVYSEWPHIINNLQTTTEKPTSSHPLLGFMSIPEYVAPLNFSALETFVGYSKVATVMTTPITPKKMNDTSISSTTSRYT